MYESYWNLKRRPFEDQADAELYYRGQSHQSALLKLRYIVESGKGAGVLVGGCGVGKSLACDILQQELPERYQPCVRMIFPQMTPVEFLTDLTIRLGADEDFVLRAESSLDRVVRLLERQLQLLSERERHPIIVIDEAHLIEDRTLFNTLLSLLNVRTARNLEFSLFLVGDPVLLAQLQRSSQLDERFSIRSLIQPLTEEETAGYIQHRMTAAGASQNIFEPSALASLFALSGGIARRINRLCDLALLVGYADGLRSLAADEVESVATELSGIAA